MKIRNFVSMAVTAVVLASALTLPAAASNAKSSTKEASPPAAGQGIFVLGSPSKSTPEGAEFYAVPKEYRGSLVIGPDVAADLQLPPGPVADSDVSTVAAKVAAVEDANRKASSQSPDGGFTTMDVNLTSFTYGPGFSWFGPYQRNTSLMGCCYHYYSWYVDGVNTSACLQGQGWYTGYNGGSFGLWSAWYSLGCGKSGGLQVPWDNVANYPKVMASSMYGYFGGGLFQ